MMRKKHCSKNETLACDLTVFTQEERDNHIAKAIDLRNAMIGMEQSSSGFKLFFKPTVKESEILAFVQDEQTCCGFVSDAKVFQDKELGIKRLVLSVKASPEDAAAWVGSFYSLSGPIKCEELDTKSKSQTRVWKWSAIFAGVMCFACLLPIIGSGLVARGLMTEYLNFGVVFYFILGASVIGLWVSWKAVRHWKAQNSTEKSSDCCGC